MRRAWSRQVGRSVRSGATTPNRNGLVIARNPLTRATSVVEQAHARARHAGERDQAEKYVLAEDDGSRRAGEAAVAQRFGGERHAAELPLRTGATADRSAARHPSRRRSGCRPG